jgi:hypothetical protein
MRAPELLLEHYLIGFAYGVAGNRMAGSTGDEHLRAGIQGLCLRMIFLGNRQSRKIGGGLIVISPVLFSRLVPGQE